MKLFSQFFASFVLSIFGFFLASPIFAINTESPNGVILSSNFSDTCTSNIQCEVLSDGQYFCHSSPENISNQGGSTHHVPVGKSGTHITSYNGVNFIESACNFGEKRVTYIGPDTYIYPFVGIIKIQV